MWMLGLKVGPLREQKMLLTAEPSLQAQPVSRHLEV